MLTFLHRPLLILALALPPLGAQPTRLELGKTVEAELGAGQTHQYVVTMRAGQFARIVVSRPDFATVMKLSEPSQEGAPLELHWPGASLRPEPLSWIAKTAGDFQMELKPAGPAATGKYSITLHDLRDTIADDSKQLEVQRLFESARGLDLKYAEAITEWERVLPLVRQLGLREREATALDSMATSFLGLGQSQSAAIYSKQALSIHIELRDILSEVNTLGSLGGAILTLDRADEAIGVFEKALSLSREVKYRFGEGSALIGLGACYARKSQFEKAIGNYEQALTIFQEAHLRIGEARALNDLGESYRRLSQYAKAISYQEKAAAIYSEGKNRNESSALLNIASSYRSLGLYEKTIEYQKLALKAAREMKVPLKEFSPLMQLGQSYDRAKRYEEALSYYEQAQVIAGTVNNPLVEIAVLNGLGGNATLSKQYQKAISYYEKALTIGRKIEDAEYESRLLHELGDVYRQLKQYEKASSHYESALTIIQGKKDRDYEAMILRSLGRTYESMSQHEKSASYLLRSVAISREMKDRSCEAQALELLMETWKSADKSRLGVFYGKQLVNIIQSIRTDIRGLDESLQKSYLKGQEKPYHTLAELLIAQGRLSEAEQVLGLLKEQEFFDYIRRDTAEAATLNRRVGLTAEEAEWEKRYAVVGDRLVTIGTERGELRAKKSLTPEETARLTQLEQDLALGNQAFEKFLGELTTNFSAKPALANRVEELRETQGIMEDLRELPAGTVAIYTLMGGEKLSVILRTPDTVKSYSFAIKSTDLNRKILEFRQVIQNPKLDPRPLAQELYNILVGPMAGDLRQAKAQTLMWSLDGALRYIPLAALYDGKQYLVEQYRMSVMTLASNSRLKDQPSAQWQAAGFGVTKAWAGSSALPSVAGELSGIITTKSGDGGVLAGEIQLDDKFTQVSMRDALRKKPTVVHIASHFQFQAGDQTNSFLLLGDGGRLSMAELRTSASLFGGVQLLTLSACNTGVGDGAEVEGFGALAQRQGAKAVIASLWPVADASTSFLMREFYRIRESTPGLSKAAAMARAQLELLRGTTKPAPGPERAMIHEAGAAPVSAPSFPVNPDAPYAHPYYWAPFFLMGNWL